METAFGLVSEQTGQLSFSRQSATNLCGGDVHPRCDMTLIEELRTNRESGAKRLEAEYKAGLIILARRLYPDPGDAEELVNRTFAEVVEGIDGFLEQSSLFTWMCRILNNLYLMDRRRKSNENIVYPGVVPEIADEEAHEAIYTNLDVSLLRDAIETLPKEMKEAIMLYYIAEQPISVAARFLRLPVSTVKWRLHVARRELARRLGATVGDAAKKPGVKALLIVIALGAITALGVATSFAVARLLSPSSPPAQEQQADDSKERAAPRALSRTDGTGETRAAVAAFVPPVASVPSVQSSFETVSSTTQRPPQEQTMNTATRTAAFGAATALALAAAPPAVTADGYQFIVSGNPESDPPASFLASDGTPLAGGPLGNRSASDALDARYRTAMASSGTGLRSDKYSGFSIILR